MTEAQHLHETQEVTMQNQATTGTRNPIARSFGAGINQGQVIPNKKRKDRTVRRRDRQIEWDE